MRNLNRVSISTLRRLLSVTLPILALGLAGNAAAVQWEMASAFPPGNFQTQNIQEFIDEIRTATNGELDIKLHSNQSLVPMPQIKRAVRSGQVQLGEVILSAYGNEDPIFEVDSIPMLSQGHENAKILWDISKPYVEKKFLEEDLIPLFSVVWPSQGIYSKKALNSLKDLQGSKFRAYNPVTSRMAELIGAVPTTVQQAEVPQAFATGIINAMITSAMTGVETQAWDFLSYYYDLRIINNKNIVFVNKSAFDKLDSDTQAAVLEAAKNAEKRGWEVSARMMEGFNENLAEKGINVLGSNADFDAELGEIGKTMADEWVKNAGPDGAELLDAYRAAIK